MHKEKNKYFPLQLWLWLGLGLCKGQEKLIVYTHKELTHRHKAACKAKREVSYLTLQINESLI